jgi:hypothetical protein
MCKTVTRCTIIVVALFSIILVSFPLFASTAGTVFNQLVDRTLKGDRLTNPPGKIGSKSQPSLVRAHKVPMGCDRAFSSISSPQFSTIFGRCLV